MSKGSTQDVGREDAKRSRRELLAGAAAGAAGALGAVAVARPTAARAADGGAVILGNDNVATDITRITNSAFGSGGFLVQSGLGPGVVGRSQSAEGVLGQSGATLPTSFGRNGIHGVTDSSGDAAVWGDNLGSPGGDGVHGSTNSAATSGVYGENAGSGYGIAGRCDAGTGASGYSANGVGVIATSPNGTALSVTGKATFNRSGSVSIAYPAKSATVTVPGGLSASALVLAVIQNAVSGVWVATAVPNTSSAKATITLNKAPGTGTAPKTATVAWFVVN